MRRSKEHSSHITTILFVIGIVFDFIILPDIDDPNAKLVGLGYLVGIGFLILFREWLVSRNTASIFEQRMYSLTTFAIVCFLGSTLSFISIYSIRSTDLTVSWPFFLFLLLCILANELVSTHNMRLALDIGILYVSTVFYFIFHLPVILGESNDSTFGVSIITALVVTLAYGVIVTRSSEAAEHESSRIYALAFGVPMFVGMMYFLNVIPAVPLSLKDKGIYHHIERSEKGTFRVLYEEDTRMFSTYRNGEVILDQQDPTLYFFSAVDAPATLTAPLSHVWEKYNQESHTWEERATIPFGIQGGRESGYRAYSIKEHVDTGLWRVTVKVDENRIVGRYTFIVNKGAAPTLLTKDL